MKKTLAIAAAAILAGCLSPAPEPAVSWPLSAAASRKQTSSPKWGAVKITRVDVRQPYDGRDIAVKRADGSMAFDRRNVFAASPAALAKWAAHDMLSSSGLAEKCIPPFSAAAADASLEIDVSRLVLDCSAGGQAKASVALRMYLLRGRDIESSSFAESNYPVAGGDIGAAFSAAFSDAASKALGKL